MWLLFGLLIGFLVWAGIWAFVGPIVAILNFICGRFFIASVLMAISLWCETQVWDDFHVGREEYIMLLGIGLALEVPKWLFKQWWQRKQEEVPPEMIINVVDDHPPPMHDITPRPRQISSRIR